MSFKQLPLPAEILKVIEELGYTNPTPVQAQAIPEVIKGSDLLASAQTGTGKTAAFLLPALTRLTKPSEIQCKGPRILVLVPTRELAMQVANEATKYSKYLSKVKTVCIYGGAPYPVQNKQLSNHYEILVATPGRLLDHMQRGRINFSRLEMMILDEADRMLDMGFIDDVQEIAKATPKTRQTLLFSATLKGAVINLSKNLLNNPLKISIAHEKATHDLIDQRLHIVDNIDHKYRLLDHFLEDDAMKQVIIFTSTKQQADTLAEKLMDSGHDSAALHGDMRQRHRIKTISQLREGKIRVLVATDVAARGIDVSTITHVINFDLPNNVEDYVHRIGRTGRAGSTGVALSFASGRDRHLVSRIEQYTGHKMASHTVAGMEPKRDGSGGGRPSFGRPRRSEGQKSFGSFKGNRSSSSQGRGKHSYGQSRPSQGKRPSRQKSA